MECEDCEDLQGQVDELESDLDQVRKELTDTLNRVEELEDLLGNSAGELEDVVKGLRAA